MFRLSCVPILKATPLKIIQTNYFQSWTKLPFAYINIATLPVETLFNKLLRCLILTFREILKPGDWYLKLSNRSEISQTEKQHSSWFSCQLTERSGSFNIDIAASILQDHRWQLSPNRYRSAGRSGKMVPGPIVRIRRGHPPPHRHRTAIVEIHNMKTVKPKNPLRTASTVPLPLRISGNVPLDFLLSLTAPIAPNPVDNPSTITKFNIPATCFALLF